MSRASRGTGAAIVDVSNVCWSAELPPVHRRNRPELGRLTTVVDAWRAVHGAGAELRLFADVSLPHCLTAQDARRWPGMVRDLAIELAPVADDPILRTAAGGAWTVLSRDRFIDHRREHPWIERHPERFLRWRVVDGVTRFVPGDIRPAPRQLVSQLKEVKSLKSAGLDPRRNRAVLSTAWRCDNDACVQAHNRQGALLLWPAVDAGGRAHCPVCSSRLLPLGPRAVTRQVVVCTAGERAELLRFPLECGTPVMLGRESAHGVSLGGIDGAPARIRRLSRQHVLLSLDETARLTVVDLGSTNGSTLHRANAAAATRIAPGRPVRVGGTDHVQLAGVVELYLSGQRFVVGAADELPGEQAGDDAGTEISPRPHGRGPHVGQGE